MIRGGLWWHFTAGGKHETSRYFFSFSDNVFTGTVNGLWRLGLDNGWFQIATADVIGEILGNRVQVDLMADTNNSTVSKVTL
jgi:hypothetical protein